MLARPRLSRSALVLLLLVGLSPATASADASQLCRSATTVLLAPTDLLLTPYIVPMDIYTGLTEQDDRLFPKVVGTVPGVLFLTYMQAGGFLLRVIAGTFEFIPGLITLPQESSPKALFTSQDEAEAFYTEDYGPCPVRIGVHYNTIPWG